MIETGLTWLPAPPPHAGWIGLVLMLLAVFLGGVNVLLRARRIRRRQR